MKSGALFVCLFIILELKAEHLSLIQRLGVVVDRWFSDSGKLADFISLYRRELINGPYDLREFDATTEIREYTSKIGQLIVQMKASLHTAVAWTEEEVSKYAWNPNLTESHLDYIQLRELSPSDERLVTHPRYPFKIMPGRSGVHVPVEVYEGDPQVFHTLQWTNSLDFIFNTTVGLHFIYFASTSGIFRVYPAFPWDKVEVDMFDIRKRPWFIQGSQVPRDVLIMLDTTGSMTGQSLRLANVSAQKLISQLDENDYFAVAHFPEADKKLPLAIVTMNVTSSPCFSSFVRATKRNKLRLFRDLSNLTARGYAHFDKAFAEGLKLFEVLNNSSRSDRTETLCNQVLVIITDNAFAFDDRMLAVLKTKPSHIRVLIYSLGDPISTISEYQRTACRYRGHYKYLPSVGAVSNMMKDYYERSTRISSGPNGSPIPPDAIFHGAGDLFQTKEYRGTGLMVSLFIPVYNRTKRSQFIGLMGTDLPIERLVAELPQHKLGPLGYAFALNPNGYVLFHPALLPQVQNLEDPPKLDWLVLEYDVNGQKRAIRRKIIDNEEGSEEVTDFIKVMDAVHVHKATRRYIFAGAPNTKFGVAFAIPVGRLYFLAPNHEIRFVVDRKPNGIFTIDGIPIEQLLKNARVFLPSKLIEKLSSWRPRERQFITSLQSRLPVPTTTTPIPTVATTQLTFDWDNTSIATGNSSGPDNTTTDSHDWFSFMKLFSRRSVGIFSDPIEPTMSNPFPFNCSSFENGVCVIMTEEPTFTLEALNATEAVDMPIVNNLTMTTSVTTIITERVASSSVDLEELNATEAAGLQIVDNTTTTTSATTTITERVASSSVDLEELNATEAAGLQIVDNTTTTTSATTTITERVASSSVDLEELNATEAAGLQIVDNTTTTTSATTTITERVASSSVDLEELNATEAAGLQIVDNTTTIASTNTITTTTINTESITPSSAPSPSSVSGHNGSDRGNPDVKRFLASIGELDRAPPEAVSRILFHLLIGEADMLHYDAATSHKPPVRSRTIFLNSGLGWTTPAGAREEFVHELTMDRPQSPIVQRVFDSDNLIFWISIKHGEPENWNKNISFMRNVTEASDEEPLITEPFESSVPANGQENDTTVLQANTAEGVVTILSSSLPTNDVEANDSLPSISLPAVTVFKSIDIEAGSGIFKAGVIGLTLEPDFLPNELRELPECKSDTGKICYLLEDAGYIVAVNDDSLAPVVQRFLGIVDPPLMHALLDSHVYEFVKEYNFQGTCTATEKTDDIGARGLRLKPNLFAMVGTQTLALALYTQCRSVHWIIALPAPFSIFVEILLQFRVTFANSNTDPYNCIQLIHRYYTPTDNTLNDLNGTIYCTVGCQRDWSVHHIRGTNLKLLVADRRCPVCESLDKKLPSDPVEDNGPDVCEEAANPRYRRLLDRCPIEDSEEDTPTCRGPNRNQSVFRVCGFLLLICLYFSAH